MNNILATHFLCVNAEPFRSLTSKSLLEKYVCYHVDQGRGLNTEIPHSLIESRVKRALKRLIIKVHLRYKEGLATTGL
ncbi:hypothetical protein RSAG8_08731, partial [Rhizoctonia solani AG-8 WAC10335]